MSGKYNRDIHHRRSIRLRKYDYSQPGVYSITICSWQRECVFGEIVDGVMELNEYGAIVEREWLRTGEIRPNVEIDKYIIMPNHFHGLLMIDDDGRGTHFAPSRRGTLQRALTTEQFAKPVSNSIPTIIRLFKSTTTKQINISRNTEGRPVWHRNYYEHIIRNEKELYTIRKYIQDNPLNWSDDEDNPDCLL